MFNLNELTTFLQCRKEIPEDAKKRARKKIDDSIGLLVDLSSFDPIQSAEPSDSSDVFEQTIAGQLTVELKREVRSQIIELLISINEAIKFDSLTNAETINCLVTENKRVIWHLMDLPGKAPSNVTGDSGSAEDTNENNGENTGEIHGENNGENNGEPASKKQKGR